MQFIYYKAVYQVFMVHHRKVWVDKEMKGINGIPAISPALPAYRQAGQRYTNRFIHFLFIIYVRSQRSKRYRK